MRKIFLSVILCAMAFVAKAQVESIDIKGSFRSDFGLGVGLTADLGNNFELSPSMNFYFWDCGTHIDFEGEFHYNIDLGKKFTFYPIVGFVICHTNLKDDHVCHYHPHLHAHEDPKHYYDGHTDFGVDIGCGIKYDFSRKCAGFIDLKYQWVNKDYDHNYDDTFFSLGVKLAI